MSKRKKRLERIRQNPKNVSFQDLRQVLEDHGFVLDRVVGSHHTFKRKEGDEIIVVPYTRAQLQSVYVRRALELIDQVIASAESEDEDDEQSED